MHAQTFYMAICTKMCIWNGASVLNTLSFLTLHILPPTYMFSTLFSTHFLGILEKELDANIFWEVMELM